jgi:PAB-dependent poly(A)-specific ribonuclease subunit 3
MNCVWASCANSNITCRYWATSGTCFFGDQCNFAHNAADRAASGKSVPKSEKACKELLLTGFCKKENNGCEYNHDIPGVTPSRAVSTSAPTANVSSNLAVSTSWTATASRAITTTTLSPGTAAAIRSKRLPVSAPAFVPAAVAAAQRAALSAWGGVTPGGGKLLTTVNAQATFTTPSASVSSSPRQNGVLLSQSQATGGSDASSSTSLTLGKQESEVTVLSSEPPPPPAAIVISSGLSSSTLIPSVLNAQPFVPNSASATAVNANGNVSLVGSTTAAPSTGTGNAAVLVPSPSVASAVSAAPFVPKAKQHLVAGGIGGGGVGLGVARPIVHGQQQQQPLMALTTPQQPQQQQQLQIRQHLSQLQQQMHQQAAAAQVQAQMLSATARSMGSSGMSSNPYLSMDVPMVMPPFRLPEGDDPALGMTAMSPPNPAFLARVASNGGLPVLPAPDAMASMGIVGDGTGGLQLGNTSSSSLSPPINYSSGIASPQSSLMGTQQQQLHHHVQRFQMQQQHHSVSGGPVPPFPVRLPQKVSGHTPEQQQLQLLSTQAVETGMGQAHEQAVPSSSASDSDQPSPPSSDTTSVQQSPQPRQQHSPQPQPQQSPSTQQAAIKQQQQQIQQQQQQLRQKLQQQQQHLQQLQQQRPQRSLSLQAHQRLPSSGYMRSLSPVSGIAPVAAATHGGATYFWGPGQGIGNVPHVLSSGSGFSVPGGRNEPRIARGQSSSSAGTVPLGSRFLPEHLREELRRRHALIHAQLDPEQDLVDLPEMVQGYHSLFPLEDVNREDDVPSTSFGVRTMIFKGISSSDGQAYAIRRIDSRQVAKAFTHMHMRLI